MNYEKLSVKEFIQKSRSGEIKPNDFYAKLFEKIEKLNEKFGCFVTIHKEGDISQKKGELTNLPVSVKDCICTKGIQSTAGSKILENYIPPFDSTVISKIKQEGSVIIGKTTQDEFGFGTFCTNSGYSVPKNPIDPERSCGGSSGGAACLTKALKYPHVALAESTGGSISCPASFCGVIGLTPTYGLVSRYGLIDYANSLDKIGCIGKEVYDVALLLSSISGQDPLDSTSIKSNENYLKSLNNNIKDLKIGVPSEYFEDVDENVGKTVWNGIKKLESLGAEYTKVSLPLTKEALSAYYIIACSESSTNLAKFCGMRYGKEEEIKGDFNTYFSKLRTKYFGEEAKRRILLGTFARMAGYRNKYYLKAMQVRTLVINEFKKLFKNYDALIAPTMPIITPKFSDIAKLSPLQHYMFDVLTVAPNLAGLPHVSIPCGTMKNNGKNLPVGMHIIGDHLQEGNILNIAYVFEKS